MEEKPRKKPVKLPAPVPVEKAPVKKKLQKQGPTKIAQSEQLTMALLMPKQAQAAVPGGGLRVKPAPGTAQGAVLVNVPKEVKVRAGKFVHLMERSDAYIHYRKNGKNSKIGEFDFRSLLLCTMESSRETLVKNMELFKGYAGIHNRQDLLTFLDHCEDRFSYLLKPQSKPARKAKR